MIRSGVFLRALACGAMLFVSSHAFAERSTPPAGAREANAAAPDARRVAPVSVAELSSRFDAVTGGADSCRAAWEGPLYYLWEFAQRRCEATQCQIAAPSRIDAVAIAWFNYGSQPSEKNVRVFVMDDAGGLPGSVLWSADVTTTLLGAGATASIAYPIDPPLEPVGPGAIWFGHEEYDAGPPSSLFDGTADGANASSPPPCGTWGLQTLGDYIQTLPVSPAEVTGVGGREDQERGGAIRIDRLASPTTTTLRFDLVLVHAASPRGDLVTVSGERAITLLDGRALAAGRHEIVADLGALAPGVYFLRVGEGGATLTRKVFLVR
ncbi:MAG: hypothetical protein ACKVU1_06295 [bacterium]